MPQRLSKEIVNKRLEGTGITLIGEYVGSTIKTEFQCTNRHIWLTMPKSILSGVGCPECAGLTPLSKEIVNSRLFNRRIKMIGEYHGVKTKTEFQCVNNHIWNTKPRVVLSGVGCIECSGKLPLTKEIVNERISHRGIIQIGKYLGTTRKTKFTCIENHEWDATPNSVLSGTGCPFCAKTGFKTELPAWVYILIFDTYIKYGITNDLQRRLSEHKNHNGHYMIGHTKYFDVGASALSWEKSVKTIFGGSFVTSDICPDGYTETICVSKLKSLIDTLN